MKRIFFLYIMMMASALLTALAQEPSSVYTVGKVPNVHTLDKRLYTTDPCKKLSATATDSVNAICERLETETGIETAVVILPSIGEASPFDFATELFRTWGLGKKKSNNGLLILYIVDQHKVRFATGYGLEGDLPDALCKRIQQQAIIPYLKNNDWDKGVVNGMQATYEALKGTMSTEPSDNSKDDTFGYLFLIFAILFTIIGPALMNNYKKRCPQCKKRALKKVSTQQLRTTQGIRIRRDTYKCEHCGYVTTKDHRDDDKPDGNSLLTGFIIGSMMGRGGSRGGGYNGGGFSGGGSFGGGSTGGGGAESGW